MRASYYLLGALLGKYGKAKVALPGGCNFGVRPIDQHLKGFEALGAETRLVDGAIIEATCDEEEGLVGTHIYLDVVSVGATMNIMLAASRRGIRRRDHEHHARREPCERSDRH